MIARLLNVVDKWVTFTLLLCISEVNSACVMYACLHTCMLHPICIRIYMQLDLFQIAYLVFHELPI